VVIPPVVVIPVVVIPVVVIPPVEVVSPVVASVLDPDVDAPLEVSSDPVEVPGWEVTVALAPTLSAWHHPWMHIKPRAQDPSISHGHPSAPAAHVSSLHDE